MPGDLEVDDKHGLVVRQSRAGQGFEGLVHHLVYLHGSGTKSVVRALVTQLSLQAQNAVKAVWSFRSFPRTAGLCLCEAYMGKDKSLRLDSCTPHKD